MNAQAIGFGTAERRNAESLIAMALAEDLGESGDVTANLTIPADARGRAIFVVRKPGSIAGLPVVGLLADAMGLGAGWSPRVEDGSKVEAGKVLAVIEGPMRAILGFERTALNFLQRLSGVATLAARFVAQVAGTRAEILDTRKTTPGWRALEKYAVRCGGGRNHRIGLYDAVLIKDNHLAWLNQVGGGVGAVATAVTRARAGASPGLVVEVEVDTFDQLDEALGVRPDIILVDNFGPDDLAEAVRRRDRSAPGVLLEVSGGVSLESARGLASTGVERISVGALTHSAPALDIGLDYD